MLPDTKKQLRYTLLKSRDNIDKYTIFNATVNAVSHLHDLISAFDYAIIGIYTPIKSEISPMNLVEYLPANTIFALPVIKENHLLFSQWHYRTPLRPGAFGIPEPEHVIPVIPNIVIVPLVGFDNRGTRLGYGKGYYDRYFVTNEGKESIRIGFAYECQHLSYIAGEEHDVPLHYAVTEQQIYRFINI